ncbi:hypothetical protein SAMN05446037_1002224 [Anaerovirgula multivorans]|uniref:Nitroimidazol reductase NimA, pyridoxamine 5'-phosphate oxidase superfamily n=1 Tax=Anaerovirgula multivorans TaxID=312168 RepID=A0A239ARM2_9FIRM|nr:pyridoxamine 5'-phosphate oxidase family protein [Anaerovirgula multivorans]SNR98356.1 hypothetical protein SAMN05446037_1002224 [Anaerovirgula multivorans]
MRRKDRELKEASEIKAILDKAMILRIALCDEERPYIVPMNFGYKEGNIYLHSAPVGRKINLLRTNNNVAFEADVDVEIVKADKPCNWSMKYRSVTGFGKATFLGNDQEKVKALDIIMEKYAGKEKFQYPEAMVERVAIIKVEIQEIAAKQA